MMKSLTRCLVAYLALSTFQGRAQDCVALAGNGPNENLTYISGFSCKDLRATPILDPTKDEIPTSPLQAVRMASKYLRDNHPKLHKEWSLESVNLHHYDFPDGSRWYYAVRFLSPMKDIPRFRPRLLIIVISSDGKVGFLKPMPEQQ